MLKKVSILFVFLGALISITYGQKLKPTIFAILNDGKIIEPIAHVEDKKLIKTVGGDELLKKKVTFNANYYNPSLSYRFIFGGKNVGGVTIKSSDPRSDCASNIAQVSVLTERTNLKGYVMGLATNLKSRRAGSGVRRLPTWSERRQINRLVKNEYARQRIPARKYRKLEYHNLTALDLDKDKRAELVGSYYVKTSAKERALLFFIAQKARNGRYYFAYKNFTKIKEKDVMSGEISALDDGIYHELLLDALDYNDDGISEIFTVSRAFEGNNFTVYRRNSKTRKWYKAFEGYNYHCGY